MKTGLHRRTGIVRGSGGVERCWHLGGSYRSPWCFVIASLREHDIDCSYACRVRTKKLEICHNFKCEQEPVFSYKSCAIIEDSGSVIWVGAFSKSLLSVWPFLSMDMYSEYRLWCVPPKIIRFIKTLWLYVSVVLRSRDNVRELFELFEIIASIRFEAFPSAWSRRRLRDVYYYPVRTGKGRVFVYYDPWTTTKIDGQTTKSRAAITHVTLDKVHIWWFTTIMTCHAFLEIVRITCTGTGRSCVSTWRATTVGWTERGNGRYWAKYCCFRLWQRTNGREWCIYHWNILEDAGVLK